MESGRLAGKWPAWANGLLGQMDCNIEPDSGKAEVKQWKK